MTPAQNATAEQILRESLPLQIPLADGLQQLSRSAQNTPVDKVVNSLLQLFGVRPGSNEAPQTIKQNVQSGGLFTERQLATQAPPQNDLKQILLQLKQGAEQLPAQQRERINTAIDKVMARVTTHQLHHLQHQTQRSDTTERIFQFDLPIYQNAQLEHVDMTIRSRKQTSSSGELQTFWGVKLNFNLQEHGQVTAEISLNETEGELSAGFICEQTKTVQLVRNQLSEFNHQLSDLGFSVQHLSAREGKISSAADAVQRKLVDIKT
ncbi:flagellar hook-length control protein FliK [Neptunomonas marina]|nr:flagellar hook-length control protein FliK [Neptunomonas marina]